MHYYRRVSLHYEYMGAKTTRPAAPMRLSASTLLAQDSSISTVARQATAVLVQLYAGRRGDEDSVTASAALTLTDRGTANSMRCTARAASSLRRVAGAPGLAGRPGATPKPDREVKTIVGTFPR
eukprot:COSAG02_NODE_6955_length_3264_cov_5.028120_1_plen_124_part_00